jgi:8-oxo-dGTP diphosphatase
VHDCWSGDRLGKKVWVGVRVFVSNDTGSFIKGKKHGKSQRRQVFKKYMFVRFIRTISYDTVTSALPGGHPNFGQSFKTCARREVLEKAGHHVKADSVRFLTAINDAMASKLKHYVTMFMCFHS